MAADKHGRALAIDDAVRVPFIKGGKPIERRMRVRRLYTTGAGVDEAQLLDGTGDELCVKCAEVEKVGAYQKDGSIVVGNPLI